MQSPPDFDVAAMQAKRFVRRQTLLLKQQQSMQDKLNQNLSEQEQNKNKQIFNNKKQHTFEKIDEINIREQCNARVNLDRDLKDSKTDKRQRLTNKALKQIERQLLDKFRQEKQIKSFTNEDDVRSKLIYETISRTNDTGYFKYVNGINDKMNNVETILQYSRDPYSYMLHKNRRLLIKLLALQERKQKELIEANRNNRSKTMGGVKTAHSIKQVGLMMKNQHQQMLQATTTKSSTSSISPSRFTSTISPQQISRRILLDRGNSTSSQLTQRQNYDAYFKLRSGSSAQFGETLKDQINSKDRQELAKAYVLNDRFNRMNELKKTFSDKNLVRSKVDSNLIVVRDQQDQEVIEDVIEDIQIEATMSLQGSRGMSSASLLNNLGLKQKSSMQQSSFNTPFNNQKQQFYKQEQTYNHPAHRLSEIRTSCNDIVKVSQKDLNHLDYQREATKILDQKQQQYFQLIATTLEEEDPTLIEAYYEFKKREDDFAKIEIKKILQDFKISSLTFQQQLDMAKWDYRNKRKKRNKSREICNRISQELSYKPIQE
eukprot:403354537